MSSPSLASLMNQAFTLHAAGRLGEAARLYRAVLSQAPGDVDAAYYLGLTLVQGGAAAAARDLLEACVPHRRRDPEAQVNLGVSRRAAGDQEAALAAFDSAIAIDEGFAPAWIESGMLAEAMGRIGEADRRLTRALALAPDNRAARLSHAIVLRKLKRFEEAGALLDALAGEGGEDIEILIGRAHLAGEQGELATAVDIARRATQAEPARVSGWLTLSKYLLKQGDDAPPGTALQAAREALALEPETVECHLQVYRALAAAKRTEEAVQTLHQVIHRDPGNISVLEELAKHYEDYGYTDEARRILTLRLRVSDDPGIAFRRALLMPIIPESTAQIERYRRQQSEDLAALRARAAAGERIDNTVAEVNRTNFFLAYHGVGNLDLQRETVDTFLALSPHLAYRAPHCVPVGDGKWGSTRPPGGKIRIGIASKHFRNHTIGKLNVRLIEGLPRDRFDVTVVHVDPIVKDAMRERIDRAADRSITVPAYLPTAWAKIAEEAFDILYYPDIGMDSGTYYLSFARLAPLQVYSWGHPDSVATPGLDAFLSSRALEVADADRDYAETLVRLASVNTCYEFPDLPDRWKSRAELRLPPSGALYGVPQTLFKFHPDVDFVYEAIAQGDPEGWIVVIAPPYTSWLDKLRERWARNAPTALSRLVALPGMPREDYLALCRLFDVMLDPPHFTGGNSSLEALAVGTPIVTWPSRYLRGRITAALYEDAGIAGLTVARIEDIAPRAISIATDPTERAALSADIEARRGVLFGNEAVIAQTADWLSASAPPRGCAPRGPDGPVRSETPGGQVSHDEREG